MRNSVSFSSARWQVQFKTVVVYGQLRRAVPRQSADGPVGCQCGPEVAVASSFWYVGLLGHPQWWQQAATEAAASGMVIISVNQATDCPPRSKTGWWTGCLGGVTATPPWWCCWNRVPRPEMEPFVAFLRDKAREGGMEFFSQPVRNPDTARSRPDLPGRPGGR